METFKLVLLETSDIHGNVFPQNYGTNEKAELGIAKIATLIKQERALNEHTITIDNGDIIQGTPLTYHYARFQQSLPNPMITILNDLNYDAGVIGNHEFNYGLGLLNQAVKESSYPWLSANIVDTETGQPYFGNPYLIKSFPDGPRVGILGLTTKYVPNWEKEEHIRGMLFEDTIATAEKWIKVLKEEEKVDLVVVSYHGGFERDLETGEPTETLTGENQGYELCMKVKGMDVLLTGHQHRQIAGNKINGVLVVQPGCNGLTLGKVTVEFHKDESGFRVVEKDSELLVVDGVNADQDVLSSIQTYEDAVQEWLDQPIGKIKGDMMITDPMAIRLGDNPLIEFINNVQMDAAGVDVSNTALFDNISPGFPVDVTMRSVVANYIYPNTLVVLRVTGKIVKDALERSAGYFELLDDGTVGVSKEFTTPKPQHYNYDMWEGIQYELDIRNPVGERVTKLDYDGKNLLPDQELDVVMNNYRSGGGGDYMMYKGRPIVKDIPIDVSELIANYILEYKEIEATVNNNWKVVY
ncbi:bifunctional metallophosphatase/5'-nucleotidase [Paucisalibacillus globulus]|uniref:bifunctional metallophosphatase/5'-nucleotidase n=1 Tax=Paucisalibacillus globulus TaxID=351095 RepID=UPI00041FC19B|nr:bifunctional UDP-sugar hydrolase/5'-nucleotidase [Paucisalibacillus globulus]